MEGTYQELVAALKVRLSEEDTNLQATAPPHYDQDPEKPSLKAILHNISDLSETLCERDPSHVIVQQMEILHEQLRFLRLHIQLSTSNLEFLKVCFGLAEFSKVMDLRKFNAVVDSANIWLNTSVMAVRVEIALIVDKVKFTGEDMKVDTCFKFCHAIFSVLYTLTFNQDISIHDMALRIYCNIFCSGFDPSKIEPDVEEESISENLVQDVISILVHRCRNMADDDFLKAATVLRLSWEGSKYSYDDVDLFPGYTEVIVWSVRVCTVRIMQSNVALMEALEHFLWLLYNIIEDEDNNLVVWKRLVLYQNLHLESHIYHMLDFMIADPSRIKEKNVEFALGILSIFSDEFGVGSVITPWDLHILEHLLTLPIGYAAMGILIQILRAAKRVLA